MFKLIGDDIEKLKIEKKINKGEVKTFCDEVSEALPAK
jgi:hypothetical protein